jgi:SAM-dependent methyltransferase
MDYPQEHIKPYGNDGKKSEQVEEMFDNIAPAYDKLNHTLSMGIDRSWRRKAIKYLRPFRPRRIMDVATGTGDFAILACRELQPDSLIGTDISEGMMNVGREKVKQAHLSNKISFVCRRKLRRRDRSVRHPQLRRAGQGTVRDVPRTKDRRTSRHTGALHTRPLPDETVVHHLLQSCHPPAR